MISVLSFVENIANMPTEEETSGGFTWENASTALNQLIVAARELTGVDPKLDKVYCVPCGVDRCDCSCDEEEADEPV